MSTTRREVRLLAEGERVQCPACLSITRKSERPFCRNLNCRVRHTHSAGELLKDRQEYRRALIYRRGGASDPERRKALDARIVEVEKVISGLRPAK